MCYCLKVIADNMSPDPSDGPPLPKGFFFSKLFHSSGLLQSKTARECAYICLVFGLIEIILLVWDASKNDL